MTVNGKRMPEAVTYAGCNRCHGFGRGLETGPLMAPGQDCLLCHDGRSATRWTVAGTWGGPGARVTLTDSTGKTLTLATNQVGNFYTAEPLRFPLTVTVGSARMPDRVTYGGCNDCHGAGGSARGLSLAPRPNQPGDAPPRARSSAPPPDAGTVTTGPLMAPRTDRLICHGPGWDGGGEALLGGDVRGGRSHRRRGRVDARELGGQLLLLRDEPELPVAFDGERERTVNEAAAHSTSAATAATGEAARVSETRPAGRSVRQEA